MAAYASGLVSERTFQWLGHKGSALELTWDAGTTLPSLQTFWGAWAFLKGR